MKIEIYNTIIRDYNYITTFIIKDYKQLKRIINKLKEIRETLTINDYKHRKIRYYIFKVNESWIISETELNNWAKKY